MCNLQGPSLFALHTLKDAQLPVNLEDLLQEGEQQHLHRVCQKG